ncbi:HD domain-containing protein [Aequorivita capsosiphonis]|uniref:HD domain-containing protein n=1 Tax=Aequorivita capsosiphonis TaxID=487317 RepID=UPI0004799211|nr:HD domain-containing protein [Aequorivita capsosiphonis]
MENDILKTVRSYCEELLNKSRCKSLQFHNYQHTLNVVQSVEVIAVKSQLSEEDLELVLISAYFHDVGNIETNRQHEMLSCSIARKFLEKENYAEDKIKTIEKIILATEINREPTTLLEEIICDADLAHLGMASFLEQNLQLREEWANFLGLIFTDEEWTDLNLKFLKTHHFYTDVARELFAKQKSENILKFQQTIFK